METIVSVSKTVMGQIGPSRVRIPPPPLIPSKGLLRAVLDAASGPLPCRPVARHPRRLAEIAVCGHS